MDIFGNPTNLKGDSHRRKVKKRSELEYNLVMEAETDHRVEEMEPKKEGFFWAKALAALLFLGLFSKLFISQVIYGKVAEDLALGNKIRPRVISSARGIITDSRGDWLARNVPTFDLSISPADLPKSKEDRYKVYRQVSEISSETFDSIKERSEANGLLVLDSVIIKENISREDSLLFEEKIAGLPGVSVTKRSSREYKTVPAISHILGYTGKISKEDLKTFPERRVSDWIGKAGLELSYENDLHGNDGLEQIEVDSRGNVDRVLVDKNNREPIAGNNLSLFLDIDLQTKTSEYLAAGMEDAKKLTGHNITSGVAIAMDPKSGGILSMVSMPFYDNNEFSKGIKNEKYQALNSDPDKPMFNRSLYGQYPPGSTIKPMMAVAGLAEGSITERTSLDTPLDIRVGDFVFPDWKDHGMTDIETAIAESNNIFFYALGGGFDKIKGMGIGNMKKWWQRFGYGEKTGIDMPGEAAGLLPDPDWKKRVMGQSWYLGDTYHAAIGQGDLLVTPIQMVRMVSAIANGGSLLKPQIVQKITSADGQVVKEFEPKVLNPQVADPSVIKTVQQGMRKTVTAGSARSLSDLPFTSAGKTGTAQFFGNQKTHAWFECFAPYDNPQIALVIIVEGGGGGNEVAVPIAKNILSYYFSR